LTSGSSFSTPSSTPNNLSTSTLPSRRCPEATGHALTRRLLRGRGPLWPWVRPLAVAHTVRVAHSGCHRTHVAGSGAPGTGSSRLRVGAGAGNVTCKWALTVTVPAKAPGCPGLGTPSRGERQVP
jgi:hypothetical protein